MKEIPIDLYSHEQKALFEGRLRLIARPVEPQPKVIHALYNDASLVTNCIFRQGDQRIHNPLGQPGDRLWARYEHWRGRGDYTANDQVWDEISRCTRWRDGRVVENLDLQLDEDGKHTLLTKRPASEMPRWASRFRLELTDVAVKRVKEISDDETRKARIPWLPKMSSFSGLAAISDGADTNGKAGLRLWWNKNFPATPYAGNPWAWLTWVTEVPR